ncbi:MAG: hypothetical protein IJD92_03625 [Bacilli bacterium]|nr:hypothetical protein [Bacilli bacterium]
MSKTKNFQFLQDLVQDINSDILFDNLCKNIKYYRLARYNEFKNSDSDNSINPYSTENIAALLDYNHNHYKRFESENDSTKKMPLEKIVKLSLILNVSIEDLLK